MYLTFIFGAILALVRVAIATPPACLIAAMGAQSNPADLKALCGTLESQVVGNITELCSGDSYSSATSIYAATCLASESVTISIPSSTSSSKSGSVTASAKTTSTGTAAGTTATGTGASAAAKATGSSTATGTATAASSTSTKTNSASSTAPTFFLAALAIGIAGFLL